MDDLPLLELFTKLREAGLPLGIDDYLLVLRALQGGFGVSDRTALKRLCQTLWVKSAEDARLFDYHFEQAIAQPESSQNVRLKDIENSLNTLDPREREVLRLRYGLDDGRMKTREEIGQIFNITREQTRQIEARALRKLRHSNSSETIPAPTMSTDTPAQSLEIEDEVQVAKATLQATSTDEETPYSRFILAGEYFPVTRRQMKQSWRYLRRPVREGLPVELDVEATVNQIGRQGILLEPILVPLRVNRTELLLLIDQDGSMVPFHALSHRLAETAVRGGRLGKADIYYFHNCPMDYLYHDSYHQEAEAIAQILPRLPQRTAVLVFSDAGAARGGYSEERIELTEKFLTQLKQRVRYIAWLNPMPKKRWLGTTAGEIACLVPMFEMTRRGLQDAIAVLRGRSKVS